MKPIIKITLTAADFTAARQCPWSGKTCLIAQAAKRTLDEYVVASSWSCVDTITRDFEYLHGYTFHDATVTRLMALFDRGHQEDAWEVAAGLPYTFAAKLTCKYQLEPKAREHYRQVFTKASDLPRKVPSLRILDQELVESLLLPGR